MEKIFITLFFIALITIFMWRFGRAAFFSNEKFKKFLEPNVKSARMLNPNYKPNYSSARITYILIFLGASFISIIFLWIIYIMWF